MGGAIEFIQVAGLAVLFFAVAGCCGARRARKTAKAKLDAQTSQVTE